jgi:hypothetical protein
MFQALNKYPPEQAIKSSYYAIRLIRHRRIIVNIREGLFVTGAEFEPSFNDRQLAISLIRDIEDIEHTALRDLGEDTAKQYQSKLAQSIETMARQIFGQNKKRGRELLKGFHSSVSGTNL